MTSSLTRTFFPLHRYSIWYNDLTQGEHKMNFQSLPTYITPDGTTVDEKTNDERVAYQILPIPEINELQIKLTPVYHSTVPSEHPIKASSIFSGEQAYRHFIESESKFISFKDYSNLKVLLSDDMKEVFLLSILDSKSSTIISLAVSMSAMEHMLQPDKPANKLAALLSVDDYLVCAHPIFNPESDLLVRQHLKLCEKESLMNIVVNPMQNCFKGYTRTLILDDERHSCTEVMISPKSQFGYRYGAIFSKWESHEHNFIGCHNCDKGFFLDMDNCKWPCYECIPDHMRAAFTQSS